MHVAILTQYYAPEIGAPPARLGALARALTNRGHKVTVLTAMPNYPGGRIYPGYGGLYRREFSDGADVYRCPIWPTNSLRLLPRLASYLSFALSALVVGLLSLRDAEYLITESPPLFLGPTGYLLARRARARWVFNVSDLWPESAVRLGAIGRGRALRAAEELEAFCYRRAWLVSGQSQGIVESIEGRYPGVNVIGLPNGADTRQFRPELRDAGLHKQLADGGSCVILYAGLHGLAQGLDQVIESARELPEDVRIVFVGDGPEKESLVAAARGMTNVSFLDPVPREDVPMLLASADVALVPLKDTLPGAVPSKLYEAMASGVPAVVVADGEPAAIVHISQAGLAVAPGNPAGIAGAIRTLAADPELRQSLGDNGRRAAVDRYDRAVVTERFVDHLERNTAGR